MLFSVTACKALKDPVLASFGKYNDYVYYSDHGFQDSTDYAKYRYSSAKPEENPYFSRVRESDFATIQEYLDDFESWIETIKRGDPTSEIVANYDFDRAVIDTDDYLYIDSEKVTWEDGLTTITRYDVYFWDAQTLILYYFHNNI